LYHRSSQLAAAIVVGVRARLLAAGTCGKTGFDLPFSQEVMADVLGLSVPQSTG